MELNYFCDQAKGWRKGALGANGFSGFSLFEKCSLVKFHDCMTLEIFFSTSEIFLV